MPDQELSLILRLKDEATSSLTKFREQLNLSDGELRKAAVGFGILGAAITAAIGFAVKAAADDEVANVRLTQSLANVGIAFDDVRQDVESFLEAESRVTAYSKDQLSVALGQLITITKDYEKAMRLLPLALDVAANKQIDVVSAAQAVGRAAQGNTRILQQYGIDLKQTGDASAALAELQERVAGSAEAYGNTTAAAFTELKNSVDELAASFGEDLLPILQSVIYALQNLVDWFNSMPDWMKNVIIAVGLLAAGFFLVVSGMAAIVMAGPILIAMLVAIGAAMDVALGPIGLIIIAIALLAAAAFVLISNWQDVSKFFTNLWSDITRDFQQGIGDIGNFLDNMIAPVRWIMDNWGVLSQFFQSLWDGIGTAFQAGVQLLVATLSPLIELIRLFVDAFKGIGDVFGTLGGLVGNIQVPSIPTMAAGGIVTGPTLALIGEKGPEAVVPLGQGGNSGGMTININTQALMGNEMEARDFARKILGYVREDNSKRFYGRLA